MDDKQFVNQVIIHKDKIARYSWYYLKDVDDVNDAVQDLFVKLWKIRNQLYKYDSILALSLRMMRNLCLDKVRKQKGFKHLSIDDLPDMIDFNNGSESKNIDLKPIYSEINKLTGLQKEIITLKDIEGYDYQEICQILEIEISAVRTNLCRARQKIRERIINRKSNED